MSEGPRFDRRSVLRLGAFALSATALGGGAWVLARRQGRTLRSEPITGEWPELEPGVFWLLPDLKGARVVVPDRPHSVEETRDPLRRKQVRRVRSFEVTTGRMRLRGGDCPPAPRPGIPRVVAIGDSVTFGWGLPAEASWPARLQEELAERGFEVEVLNAGVPAQTLRGMRAWLTRIAPGLGVSLVILARRPPPAAGVNAFDEYARTVQDCGQAIPGVRVQVVLPPISRFDPFGNRAWAFEQSALVERLPTTPVLELTPVFRAAQGNEGVTLREREGRMELVDLETGHLLLSAKAVPSDLPTAFYEAFEADRSLREPLLFDTGHPDAEGMRLFARSVADALLKEGALGAGGSGSRKG